MNKRLNNFEKELDERDKKIQQNINKIGNIENILVKMEQKIDNFDFNKPLPTK